MVFEELTLKDSQSIAAAAYDSDGKTLRITFKASQPWRTYDYLKVPPQVVEEFLSAESLGRFVNFRIKPYYEAREVI